MACLGKKRLLLIITLMERLSPSDFWLREQTGMSGHRFADSISDIVQLDAHKKTCSKCGRQFSGTHMCSGR